MSARCSRPGCGRQHWARGLCRQDYDAWRRTGSRRRPCTTDRCPNPRRARGYCTTCLGRRDRYGDPEFNPAASVDEIAVDRAVAGEPPDRMTVAEREEAVRRLHGRGWSDRQIAARIGISFPATVAKIRQRLGLPPNSPALGGRRHPRPAPARR